MVKLTKNNKETGKLDIEFFSNRDDFNESYEHIDSEVCVSFLEPDNIYSNDAYSFFMSDSKEAIYSCLEGTDSVMILVHVFDDYEDACGWLNEYKRD